MLLSNKIHVPNDFLVKINDEPLERCDSYKYLGVIFDKNLNWKEHISYVCQKVSKACGALAKLRHCVNTNVLKEVYYSLFYSYIRYGLLVWGNASDSTLKPIQTVMNRAVRIITFAPFGRIDLTDLYDCLRILDVNKIFRLETAKYLFKEKNDLLPVSIANHFTPRSNLPEITYNLRPRLTPSYTFRLASIQEKSIKSKETIWNEIPEHIKHNCSFNSFKKTVESILDRILTLF